MPTPEELAAQKREEAQKKIQGMIDQKVTEMGAKNAETMAKLEKNQADMLVKLEAWDKYAKENHSRVSLPGTEDAVKKGDFMYSRLIMGIKRGNLEKYAPKEYDIIKETMKKSGDTETLKELDYMVKTQQLGVDTTGGYLVPPQISGELIEALVDLPLLSILGAQTYPNLSGGEFRIPVQSGNSTIYHVAEGAAPTASTITFQQKTMRKHRAKALVRISNDLEGANPAVEGVVRNDIMTQMALTLDVKGWRGTGAENEPTGLINQGSGLNTVSCAGAITMAKMHDFIAAIEQDLALQLPNNKFAWVMNARTRNVIRQFTNAVTGDYFFRPEAWAGEKSTYLGYPVYTSNQVPKTLSTGGLTNVAEVYFGNWNEFIIGIFGGLEIRPFDQVNLASTDAAALLDETWIYAVMKYDVMVRHPQSFCVCTDTTS